MNRLLIVPVLLACLSVVSFAQSDSGEGSDSPGRRADAGAQDALFEPAPGRYEENVLLSLRTPAAETSAARGSTVARSRRLEYRVSGVGASDFVGYQGPLRLSALPGEARSYRVTARLVEGDQVLREEEARYTIDRRLPPPPEISALSGFYREPVEIGFAAPEGATVYHALDGPAFAAWNGNDIRLTGEAGARVEYLVEAFARFEDGPAGPVTARRIVIDRNTAKPDGIRIGSPAPGEWANPQLLYIEDAGFSEIRYTTDGSDPGGGGTLYEGPVVLETDGRVRLRVRGVTPEGEVFSDNLEFSAGSRRLLGVEQGVRTESFELPPPSDGVYRYRRSASDVNSLFSRPVSLTVQRGSRRGAEILVEGPVDRREDAASFRYFFLLDGRVPTPPDVAIGVRGRDALVTMTGNRGAEVEYELRIDGESVSQGSYENPVEVTLPAGRESGEIEVRALSAYGDGRVSEPATARRAFDTSPPAVPVLGLPGGGPAGSVSLSVRADAQSSVLYQMAFGSEPPDPDEFSPRLDAASPLLALPHGVEGRASIRLRARDAAGNLSERSPVYRVDLDARPPQPPRIIVDRNVVRLAGDGTMYFTLSAPAGGDTAPAYARYEGPLRLGGRAGEKMRYALTAYASDEVGNRSETVTHIEEVDRRIPRVPASMSVVDGGQYAQPEVRFQISGNAGDLILHYTATTDGSEPSEPTPEDPTVPRDGIRFSASEGEEVPVHLKIVPRFAGSEVTGRTREIRFALDRRAPELPALAGIDPGGAYPAPRQLELRPADPETDDITVVLRETVGDGQGTELSFSYGEPVLLAGSEGRETLYEIELRVTDPAGNMRAVEEPIRVVIDRSAPDVGELMVSGEEGTSIFGMASDGPVVLRRSSPDLRVRYELTEDGSPPAPVSSSSPRLGEELRLTGRADDEVLYRVAYRSEDAAGNMSSDTASLVMEVDRHPPPAPAGPSIRVAEDGRSARLAWSAEPGLRTGFRVVDDRDRDFRRADERSEISFPSGETRVTVEAMQVDEVGNRSETRRFEVRGFTVSPQPQLSGVRPGETYGDTVVLRNGTAGATVRYELATGDAEPDVPTRFSEELPETLPFDVSPGETLRYTVRARAFDDDARPSEVVELSFTVDRTPPPPPELVNARSGDFYTGSRVVELEAPEGEIRYRLSLVREEAGDFRPYEGQVMLDAVRGQLAHYQLEAFVVDGAGNRSGTPRVWDLYIDQEIVYVSEDGGTGGDPDSGAAADGGRDAPFSRLADAVDFALSRDRRTIFVSGGSYRVSAPLRVDGDLSIQGGLSSDTWRRADDQVTEIRTSESFAGDALFDVRDASLTLERLDVTADGVTALAGDQSTIFMQGISATSDQAPETLRLVNSSLEARNSEIRARRLGGDAAIDLEASVASLERVTIEAESAGGDFSVILAGGDSDLELRNSSVTAGPGRRSAAVRVDDSVVRVYESELSAGPARESSDVLRSGGSDVLLINNRLAAADGASISTAVSASGGELRLEGNTIEVEGERGATGLFARGSRITASGNGFRSGETSEFLHVVSLRDVTASLDTNLFLGGRSREVIVGRIVGSETSWYNNTIRGGAGSRFTQGFNLNGASRATLVNNVVFHAGEGTGTAVYASEDVRSLRITANAFSGWDAVYRQAPDGRRWLPPGGDPASEAPTAEELDRRNDVTSGSNLDLADQDVFADDVHLRAGAPLIDAGVYVGDGEGPRVDWDGQERPRPGEGSYDIGADEFFR